LFGGGTNKHQNAASPRQLNTKENISAAQIKKGKQRYLYPDKLFNTPGVWNGLPGKAVMKLLVRSKSRKGNTGELRNLGNRKNYFPSRGGKWETV